MIKKLNNIIMGKRPYNTIFSFNYSTLSHTVKFLRSCKKYMKKDISLLDVGAGSSPFYEFFQDMVSDYIAVDMEPSLPQKETRNIKQKVGTAEALPIETNSIDVVLTTQVLSHVLDEREAVKECWRVLKPGGFFIASVLSMAPINCEPYDFRRFTYYGIKKLLEDNNFKIIEISGCGGVHTTIVFVMLMDWYLSVLKDGSKQKFNGFLHVIMFLANGFFNILGIALDKLIKNTKRSHSIYCCIAVKEDKS